MLSHNAPHRRRILWAFGLALAGTWLGASTAAAHRDDTHPNLLHYGTQGLATGALTGLSVGYLATGSDYDSHEWKALAYGAGIGAVVGIGTGVALGLADITQDSRGGSIAMRDTGYGTLLGSVMGSLIGLLVWIESESGRDILRGGAIGAVSGSAAGLVFGLFDASTASSRERSHVHEHRHRRHRRLQSVDKTVHVVIGAAPLPGGGMSFLTTASGRF